MATVKKEALYHHLTLIESSARTAREAMARESYFRVRAAGLVVAGQGDDFAGLAAEAAKIVNHELMTCLSNAETLMSMISPAGPDNGRAR